MQLFCAYVFVIGWRTVLRARARILHISGMLKKKKYKKPLFLPGLEGLNNGFLF